MSNLTRLRIIFEAEAVYRAMVYYNWDPSVWIIAPAAALTLAVLAIQATAIWQWDFGGER